MRGLGYCLLLLLLLAMRPAAAAEVLIIANSSVSVPPPLTQRELSAIYLLRVTLWPDGTPIVPVNREASCEIRARFTAEALNQDSAGLAAYWNEMHFQGKLPPVVQESDQAVLAFVQHVPGAVGYISADSVPASAISGVRVLGRVP